MISLIVIQTHEHVTEGELEAALTPLGLNIWSWDNNTGTAIIEVASTEAVARLSEILKLPHVRKADIVL